MSDIIRLLPDSVANQIAAGEVIQRPASLVKELLENAIDAGGTEIKVNIKDAGRSLVQVIDNGCGMSETDARLSFERHATSKISEAKDLFAIRTMGFRGEALASIAAVSQVELKTRRSEDELGTHILINGSEFEEQKPCSCAQGSNFSIKNLFYNVPARRKFLKTNTTELKHIINEFHRIVLSHPDIAFTLHHNDTEVYHLHVGNLRQRLIQVFGKGINHYLIPVDTDTSIVKVNGYIGKPEFARKTFGEQFFFVNNRYMRHPYFHKAVMEGYGQILAPETIPSYFIFLSADPETIDINIHPTKTEIKFEDERSIWQILIASVKEALGKFNIVPSLDFDKEGSIEIPVAKKGEEVHPPTIDINTDYNPFAGDEKTYPTNIRRSRFEKANLTNWEKLYHDPDQDDNTHPSKQATQPTLETDRKQAGLSFIQLKNKFILCPVKSGLMTIDQKRAHERILYEKYLRSMEGKFGVAQQNLFPQTIQLNASDHAVLLDILEDICSLGFDIRDLGNHTIVVNGYPSNAATNDPGEMIELLLEEYKSTGTDVREGTKEKICRSLAKASAIPYGKSLSREEMQDMIDALFACENPNYSPSGKPVLTILAIDEIEDLLKA